MSEFKKKRESLEQFVEEQVIGPGAYNKKYFFLNNWKHSDFVGQNLKDTVVCPAIDNISELIPEVPAYQYSSGILFPETKELQEAGTEMKDAETISETDIEGLEVNLSADDESIVDDTAESVIRKQQNYPNQLGLSFVVKDEVNLEEDLSISLSFRKYKQISKKDCFDRNIAIRVLEYEDEIKDAILKYFGTTFNTEEKDGNLFVSPIKEFSNEDLYRIDYEFLHAFLKENIMPLFSKAFNNEIDKVESKDGITYYGIKVDKYTKRFYSIADNRTYGGISFTNIITLFDDSIIAHIKERLAIDIKIYSSYRELIKKIEIYNHLKELTNDLKAILKEGKSLPIWESKYYLRSITLPNFPNDNNIFRKQKLPVVTEGEEDYQDLSGLKFSVQYFRKQNLIYIKLIILNTNTIELKVNESKQLNKKDTANEISFFGVKLKIIENRADCLQQYNPPQFLKIDQEDNFNKLVYRKYINYGEGYNTSVNWGEENGYNFIATEFLPSQEVPDVGVVPMKIVNKQVVKRIENDHMLSMGFLSTLSIDAIKDDDILDGLTQFIDAYGGENGWISDKLNDIEGNPEKLDDEAHNLLINQLEACKRDYKRLKRNIELLRNDEKAMTAFRTMNTAMFMQLHHSMQKNEQSPFIINDDDYEEYYKTIASENPYKWRSFQLGFILLNIDAFVKPKDDDNTVDDVFNTGWPERNEIADLVWFPTGGGKTEAYLGIIAFSIAYRRFTQGKRAYGTTVLMRYTLRMLTLQQFQRATLLICALEAIRKDDFYLPKRCYLGDERITIGMFVGSGSLPNKWSGEKDSMISEFNKISNSIATNSKLSTNLPFIDCPWCGGDLFIDEQLPNVKPNHTRGSTYGINDQLNIACNSKGCTFHSIRSSDLNSLPLRLFDEDIYKFPPTLLFGTVDKFAALANNISTVAGGRNKDSRRLVGKGYKHDVLPPELIIQDELHLLLGPLGSSVGLFEKGIDTLCTYDDANGNMIRPKIVTSTATTRNTDKQIFALFNRRSEIFPKQGIFADDSFFAFNKRNENNVEEYESKRKYIGVLPVGKTQVWMQLRIASITLAHRLKHLKQSHSLDDIFETPDNLEKLKKVFDYYHTILAYYNSLKEVGKTQSQLSHYLPTDLNYIIKNTTAWSFIDQLIRKKGEINESELTGRLTGEEVKTNLADIEKVWTLITNNQGKKSLNINNPPEFVIATNMISVGIDVSRFNTMIINSMPRNIAEYIQASSRVARDESGIVFTVHHPYRSRDISHYQKFKEFHEKFYSYVEPISVTPFASKALDRYLAMYVAVLIRHSESLDLMNNEDAIKLNHDKIASIKELVVKDIEKVKENAKFLERYLSEERTYGIKSSIDGIISSEEIDNLKIKLDDLLRNWIELLENSAEPIELKFRNNYNEPITNSLFIISKNINYPGRWKVGYSLRDIGAQTVIKTVQQ